MCGASWTMAKAYHYDEPAFIKIMERYLFRTINPKNYSGQSFVNDLDSRKNVRGNSVDKMRDISKKTIKSTIRYIKRA